MAAKSSKRAVNARKTNMDPVSEFYTNHPYPTPLDNLDRARDLWQDQNVHRAEFHLFWPNKEYRPDLDVLVAGCGTWQSAKFALCHPAASVTGIDLSPTSLEHTEALKKKHELANLATRQLAIENAHKLDHEFDLIVCTGVLHHLVDPDAGLRSLRSVLKPDGAMYLMLYAPYGRTGVAMLQDYCRKLAIGTSEQEINDLTALLKALPQHHPLLSMLRGAREMDANTLVDALLNPRDRTYSVPQLLDFVERNELSFGRWYWQAAYLPQCGQIATTPHADRLNALAEREQYAAMELWRGLMTNHDFVVHPSEAETNGAKVHFNDDRYLGYVPIRRAWTTCITDRVPPTAAGVLVNQTHLFQDLFLFVDAQEKQMFEAIDGRRSISEIVDTTEGESSRARVFFEKLWRYDQVVFDTFDSR
jgi:SAM-dependent methyltransferase